MSCSSLHIQSSFRTKLPSSTIPLSFDAPSPNYQRTLAKSASHIPYISRNQNHRPTFAVDTMGPYSFKIFSWAPQNDFFLQECISVVQGHPRSLILVLIESAYATSY